MATAGMKKVDPRVSELIHLGVARGHRSMFVLVGDRGRDQVVNLHYCLSKARVVRTVFPPHGQGKPTTTPSATRAKTLHSPAAAGGPKG